MKDFGAMVFLEMRLTLHSNFFWFLAILSILAIHLPFLTLLLNQLILIYQFTRDDRANFSPILCTLPHTTDKLYLARAVAALLILLSLCPFMFANLGFFPEMTLAKWLFSPKLLLFLMLKYFVICLIQVSIILFLSSFTRYLPWLYLLCILFWEKTAELASNLSLLPSFSKLFVFGQGFMLPAEPSLATGFFPEQDIYPGFALFHAGLALLFIIVATAKQMIQRREPLHCSKLLITLFFLSLTALWSGSHIVLTELNHREHGFRALIQTAATKQTSPPNTAATLKLESYQLAVKLKTASHYFDGTAIIKGKINHLSSDRILFTLRDCFTVTAVTESAAGEPLTWSQSGAALTVYLPKAYQEKDAVTLSISYNGEVWEWFPDRMAQPNGPVNFIAPPYSLLRSGYAWYPTPGLQDLYTYYDYLNSLTDTKTTTLRANRILHAPIPFTMTVDIDTDNMVATNLEQTGTETGSGEYKQRYHFYSEHGHDLFLLAGPYQHQTRSTPDGKISVYHFPVHEQQIDRVTNSLSKLCTVYADLLQEKVVSDKHQQHEKNNYTLVEVPPFLLFSEDGRSLKNLTLTDTIMLSENYFKTAIHTLNFLSQIQDNKRDFAILQRWWQEDLTESFNAKKWGNGNINYSLSYYLYIVGLEKTRAPKAYLEAKQNIIAGNSLLLDDFCMPFLPIDPVTQEVFLVLDTLRTELGDQALKKVMRPLYHLYATQGSIQAVQFSQRVKTILTSSPMSPEKQGEIQNHLLRIEEFAANPGIINTSSSLTGFSFDREGYMP